MLLLHVSYSNTCAVFECHIYQVLSQVFLLIKIVPKASMAVVFSQRRRYAPPLPLPHKLTHFNMLVMINHQHQDKAKLVIYFKVLNVDKWNPIQAAGELFPVCDAPFHKTAFSIHRSYEQIKQNL
mgnify:CR=1 FL=1